MLASPFSRFFLFVVLCCLSAKCSQEQPSHDEDPMTVTVPDASKPFQTWVHLDQKDWMIVRCEVIQNTLNDTAMLGGAIIAPNQLGLCYKCEWYIDSIPFSYRPYKATKGILKVRHYTKS